MKLTKQDIDLIGRCLRAAVSGPYFSDCEFQTLFGLTREEVAAVAGTWPQSLDTDAVKVAVQATLNNLTGYPHKLEAPLCAELGVDMVEVESVFRRWMSRSTD